jgi:hypothetical protein
MSAHSIRLNLGILFLLISLLAAWIATDGRAAETTQSAKQPAPPTVGELHQLLKARYAAAVSLLEIEEKRLEQGKSSLMKVWEAARRVGDSARELTGEPAEQLKALTTYLAVTCRLEEETNKAVALGAAPPSDKELARYLRLDAEIALLRARLQEGGAR